MMMGDEAAVGKEEAGISGLQAVRKRLVATLPIPNAIKRRKSRRVIFVISHLQRFYGSAVSDTAYTTRTQSLMRIRIESQ
jgi:hypothetical protein